MCILWVLRVLHSVLNKLEYPKMSAYPTRCSFCTANVIVINYITFFFSAQCKQGTYSSNGLETCESCPLGSYQPAFGSRSCLFCPENTSTVKRGAVDIAACGGYQTLRHWYFSKPTRFCAWSSEIFSVKPYVYCMQRM